MLRLSMQESYVSAWLLIVASARVITFLDDWILPAVELLCTLPAYERPEGFTFSTV